MDTLKKGQQEAQERLDQLHEERDQVGHQSSELDWWATSLASWTGGLV